MYSISLSGYYEVEEADAFLKDIEDVANKHKAAIVGYWGRYKLAPYIDYQVCDVTDSVDSNSDI